MMARVLVTGFEPFSNNSTNISGDLVKTLGKDLIVGDPWSEIRDYELKDIEVKLDTEILSVDEYGAKLTSEMLSFGGQWDAIIHLGLCQSCQIPRIELMAHKIIDMKIKDNSGRQLRQHSIGSIDHKSTVNSNLIFTNNATINAEISFDAGKFVCNETYYNTLSKINEVNNEGHITPCLFLHLPDYDKFSLQSGRELLLNMIGRILFKPVISVAAGAILKDRKMLVAKRNDGDNMGLWEFPGGKFEWGENQSEAIIRELKEEFNWNVKTLKSFGKWFHKTEHFDIDLNVEICQFIDQIPNLDNKESWTSHDEVKWIIDEGEVDQYIGIDRLVAKELFKELSNPSSSFT